MTNIRHIKDGQKVCNIAQFKYNPLIGEDDITSKSVMVKERPFLRYLFWKDSVQSCIVEFSVKIESREWLSEQKTHSHCLASL